MSEEDKIVEPDDSGTPETDEKLKPLEKDEDKGIGMAEKSHNVEFTNDPEIDKVVDKIVNEESDELMKSQDEKREGQFDPPKTKRSFFGKAKALFLVWWNNKLVRNLSLVAFGLLAVLLIGIPTTRYGILNLSGVRVESSMTIVDSETGLPLRNIPVAMQGQEKRSDDDGNVYFKELKLGRTQLTIDRVGYASFEKSITLGWGSNPLGPQPLYATGTQFTFVLNDWLSDKTITTSSASSGEDYAQADENGKIILNVSKLEESSEILLSAEGYRDETVKVANLSVEENLVSMVPSKKHVFVSNRDGQYDLYKVYLDGQDEEILLAATGKEREVPFVVPHQTRDEVAYISSRDGETNKDNFILDGLFIIDVESGKSRKIARSEQLQIIGWSGNKLVYVAVVEGVSAGNSQRSKIFSYDVNNGDKIELASSNYFNDVKLVEDTVYFAVSSYAVPNSAAKLFSIKPDGEDKKTLVDTQVWSIVRAGFDTLYFNAIDLVWYEQVNGQEVTKLDQQPAEKIGRYYVTSPDKTKSIWIDVRDGKGVLLNYDVAEKSDTIIHTQAGLGSPAYWISDNYLVFRVSNNDETSDYVLNLDGGEPIKISDVVGNLSRYFY